MYNKETIKQKKEISKEKDKKKRNRGEEYEVSKSSNKLITEDGTMASFGFKNEYNK